jgi:hypothetical protein
MIRTKVAGAALGTTLLFGALARPSPPRRTTTRLWTTR